MNEGGRDGAGEMTLPVNHKPQTDLTSGQYGVPSFPRHVTTVHPVRHSGTFVSYGVSVGHTLQDADNTH